jgi:hypothetical protein
MIISFIPYAGTCLVRPADLSSLTFLFNLPFFFAIDTDAAETVATIAEETIEEATAKTFSLLELL